MKVTNSVNTPNFGAKFLYSKSLNDVANYAIMWNKYDSLVKARTNIARSYLKTKIKLDTGKTPDGNPCAIFTIYEPRMRVTDPKYEADYNMSTVVYVSEDKNELPYKFALKKILELGKRAPNNKMFQDIIVNAFS